jgi:hypothetical protein
MKENSSVLELTGYDSSILTKDKLFKNALELLLTLYTTRKAALKQNLSR